MGDLAHELESLIISIELGNTAPSAEARHTLQRSLDELARMRDLLSNGKAIPAAPPLLSQVRALMGLADEPIAEEPGSDVDEAAAETVPEIIAISEPEPESQDAWVETASDAPGLQSGSTRRGAGAPPPATATRTPAVFDRLMAAAIVPPGASHVAPERTEMARVDAELLNQLLNQRAR